MAVVHPLFLINAAEGQPSYNRLDLCYFGNHGVLQATPVKTESKDL